MDNPGEILGLCRLCLVKDQVNIPIFEEQGDIRQIFLKISSCLPVKVSRDDKLPKKICDGCSNKLDLLYEFWNTSANAEKTLLSWLGQAGVKDADETINAVAQQIAKPAETQVKEETETLEDGHVNSQNQDSFEQQSFDEGTKDEDEAPPPKRARRSAAVKAQINIAPESDDDDDDMDSAEPMTKMEGESDESDGEEKDPSYAEVPGTSADDQAGPSGVGKDGAEAPKLEHVLRKASKLCLVCVTEFPSRKKLLDHLENLVIDVSSYCSTCEKCFRSDEECGDPIGCKEYYCNICDVQLDHSGLKDHICFHTFKNTNKTKSSGRKKSLRLSNRSFAREQELKKENTLNDLREGISSNGKDEDCKIKRDTSEETDICIFCSAEVPLKFLEEHENAHREEEKRRAKQHRLPIPKDGVTICTICGASVSCKELKKHERTHRRLDTVICSICGFPARNIYQHMVTHSDERRFACQECGLAFKHKKNLDAHMLVHETVGKHKCTTCGKAFKTPYNLRVHIRSHQDIKPFPCQYCEKTFTTKQSRDNHMKTHITQNL